MTKYVKNISVNFPLKFMTDVDDFYLWNAFLFIMLFSAWNIPEKVCVRMCVGGEGALGNYLEANGAPGWNILGTTAI